MLDRYVQAFWDKDIDAIVSMLTRDAVSEMPPYTGWYQGAENIGRLIDTQCPGGRHDMRMLPTRANGQPAFGLYMRGDDGGFHPFHLQVLTLGPDGVEHVAVQHVPGTDLLLDHVVAGAFEVHRAGLVVGSVRRTERARRVQGRSVRRTV